MRSIFILPAILLILAAILWYTQARSPASNVCHSSAPPAQKPEIAAHTIEALAAAVTALQALMEHPDLGGPGFLTIRIQESSAAVTAQYPNIREALYRRIIRQELAPADLLPEGVPERLLELSPEYETESGGMVLVTVWAGVPNALLTQAQASLRGRQAVLSGLAAELRPCCPALSIRVIGGELILTPLREPVEV